MGNETLSVATIGEGRRWSMLALGVFGQAASAMFVNGTPFLIPILQRQGLSLSQAGLLVAMPMVGLVLALIPWGAVMDRIGERKVLVSGLGLLCAAAVGAALSGSYVVLGTFFVLGGIAAASTNGASGRVIVGWFPPERRGFAMGIRQTAQPLGVGLVRSPCRRSQRRRHPRRAGGARGDGRPGRTRMPRRHPRSPAPARRGRAGE